MMPIKVKINKKTARKFIIFTPIYKIKIFFIYCKKRFVKWKSYTKKYSLR